MNINEHVLTILGEECVEVALAAAQRVSKSLRFGMGEVEPGQDKSNAERIMQEFDDLVAVVQMCQERGLLPESSPSRIEAKKTKVQKFLEYSATCGTLT